MWCPSRCNSRTPSLGFSISQKRTQSAYKWFDILKMLHQVCLVHGQCNHPYSFLFGWWALLCQDVTLSTSETKFDFALFFLPNTIYFRQIALFLTLNDEANIFTQFKPKQNITVGYKSCFKPSFLVKNRGNHMLHLDAKFSNGHK